MGGQSLPAVEVSMTGVHTQRLAQLTLSDSKAASSLGLVDAGWEAELTPSQLLDSMRGLEEFVENRPKASC